MTPRKFVNKTIYLHARKASDGDYCVACENAGDDAETAVVVIEFGPIYMRTEIALCTACLGATTGTLCGWAHANLEHTCDA